jgi:hypothetical protein
MPLPFHTICQDNMKRARLYQRTFIDNAGCGIYAELEQI